jgi:hypothetical protein
MRKALRACALVLALGCPVVAGEIQNPVVQPPPPSAPTEPTTEGEIHFPLVEIALTLLALF